MRTSPPRIHKPVIAAQLRILEHLLERFGRQTVGCCTARFPLPPQQVLEPEISSGDLFFNHRALILHHHWKKQHCPALTPDEKTRVAPVLQRISEQCPRRPVERPWNIPKERHSFLKPLETLLVDSTDWLARFLDSYARARFAARTGPALSDEAVESLGAGAQNASSESASLSVAMMLCCDNPRVIDYAVAAWRSRIAANRFDSAAGMLEEMLCQPLRRMRACDLFRLELGNALSSVRLRALLMLEKIGGLDDVGLMLDLLSVPAQGEDQTRERDALLRAACELSGARNLRMQAPTISTAITLYEDWLRRRKRLSASSGAFRRRYAAAEAAVFDFLLAQYRERPEAQHTAPFAVPAEAFADRRAILVYHQLGKTEIVGVKTEQEASKRASSILQRMASMNLQDSAKSFVDAGRVKSEEPVPVLKDAACLPSAAQLGIWQRIEEEILIRGTKNHSNMILKLIGDALSLGPALPEKAVYYLSCQVANAQAVELLARCENRSAVDYMLGAWRRRMSTRKLGPAHAQLFFLSAARREQVLEKFRREMLSAEKPKMRLAAIRILGRVGHIEDISLLSDILGLPRHRNEDPRERPAILCAMRRLAGMRPPPPVLV
ncbi:MAG TPA: hypothetical protein VEK08_06320 [Planctomycetota bacterium]|nr:hypothetical protein [Planctomycetota bacterium]